LIFVLSRSRVRTPKFNLSAARKRCHDSDDMAIFDPRRRRAVVGLGCGLTLWLGADRCVQSGLQRLPLLRRQGTGLPASDCPPRFPHPAKNSAGAADRDKGRRFFAQRGVCSASRRVIH